jgi:hypothetical protein
MEANKNKNVVNYTIFLPQCKEGGDIYSKIIILTTICVLSVSPLTSVTESN